MVLGMMAVATSAGWVVRGGADKVWHDIRRRHFGEREYWRGYVNAVADLHREGVELVTPPRELPASGVPDGMMFDPFGWSDADELAMITWQGEDL